MSSFHRVALVATNQIFGCIHLLRQIINQVEDLSESVKELRATYGVGERQCDPDVVSIQIPEIDRPDVYFDVIDAEVIVNNVECVETINIFDKVDVDLTFSYERVSHLVYYVSRAANLFESFNLSMNDVRNDSKQMVYYLPLMICWFFFVDRWIHDPGG